MARSWEMSPADAASDGAPLLIVDPSNGLEGRAVCIQSGNLSRQARDSTLERMLNDHDLKNANAIMPVPRMRQVLAERVPWAAHMAAVSKVPPA